MNSASLPNPGSLPAAVKDRCRALGLALWILDEQGIPFHQAEGPEAALPWLEAPRVQDLIQEVTASWSVANGPRPLQLFPGCWLIPVWSSKGIRRSSALAVLGLDKVALDEPEFAQICESAQLELEQGRAAVKSLVHESGIDPDQVAMILQWSVEDLAEDSRHKVALEEFSEKLIQAYEESNFLYHLARLLKCSASSLEAIQSTCLQMYEIMPFGWVAIRFFGNTSVSDLAGQFILAGQLPCCPDRFEAMATELMRQWRGDCWTSLLAPDTSPLAELVGSEVIAERITHDGTLVGGLLAGNMNARDLEVSSHETQFFDAAADFVGVFHENLSRFEEQRSMFMGTLRALTASIDAKDRYTCGHSDRVSMLGSQLATVMGLDQPQIEQVRIAGLVHDVGKIGIPESVLCKPGRLTDEEFEQIKRHPVIGYEILKDIPPLADMLPGVRYHHERWDGHGYPEGLAGEEIPLYGRLLACADTFDAMSSTRSYRPAMPRGKVLEEIHRSSGSQFDEAVVEQFLKIDLSLYDGMVERHRAASSFAA